jgi:DNA invertase Pin-like site-specific DNA recombinase
MKRAIGLVRVSSEDQKDEGFGIPEQVEKILNHVESQGYTLVDTTGFATDGIDYLPGFFQEDYTGKTPFRPAIFALQQAIDKHLIQVIVIHRTNRLGRRGSVQQVLEADFRTATGSSKK